MRTILAAAVSLALIGLAGCTPTYSFQDGREASTLTGGALMRIEPDASKMSKLEQDLAAAKVAWERTPTEATAIALGRAYSSLGRFKEGIAAFGDGLAAFPDSHRLRRHRGHRYITVREFRESSRDYNKAWDLVRDKPDTLESADGSSTDKSAILYHWGLLEYLRGQFDWADDVFSKRTLLTTLKDENVVSAASWHYWALRRLGRDADAAKVIEPIREGMDVKENKSYYTLCRLYRGLISAAEVEKQMTGDDGKLNVGLAYGLACWKRFELKDEAGGRALLKRIIATGNWPAFGFIAAEADLARWPG
ncbi:MAG: hypothetical protein Q8L55_03385 [Phycisphaerales bacterium]|nr:hypothetical protein [Phycisphaerales bacterium]